MQKQNNKKEEKEQKKERKNSFNYVRYGINVPTAYEVALKIKEASYDNTEGFQIEQYVLLAYLLPLFYSCA